MSEINYLALFVILAVYMVVQSTIIIIKMELREKNLFRMEYLGCYVYSDMTYKRCYQENKEVIGVVVEFNKESVTIMKCCNYRFVDLWNEVPAHVGLVSFRSDIMQVRLNEYLSEVNRNSSLTWKLATEKNYRNLFANFDKFSEVLAKADDDYYRKHRVESLPVGICTDKNYAYDGEDLNVCSFSFIDSKIKKTKKSDYMRLVSEVKFEDLKAR